MGFVLYLHTVYLLFEVSPISTSIGFDIFEKK